MRLSVLAGVLFAAVCLISSVAVACPDNYSKGLFGFCYPNIGPPHSIFELLFPPCWGSPQACRDSAGGIASNAGGGGQPLYSVAFRVDCEDTTRTPPAPSGDATLTFVSPISFDDARQKAIAAYNSMNLCQQDPNYIVPGREMVPGSGRFLDGETVRFLVKLRPGPCHPGGCKRLE